MEHFDAFDQIIGYDYVKKELSIVLDILKNKDKYTRLGVNTPNAVILSGEPGIGKTLFATSFINGSGLPFVRLRKTKPDGSFVKQIMKSFDDASKIAPSILFLDDMDKFADTEGRRNSNADEFVTIQSCIDNTKRKGIFIIATCNNLSYIPDSLLRPGRFDDIIELKAPNVKDAQKIIEHYLKGLPNVGELDTALLAEILDGQSCASLETIINQAGLYAGFENKSMIMMDDVMDIVIKTLFCKRDGSYVKIDPRYIREIAIHEAGHVLISELTSPHSVALVTIKDLGNQLSGVTKTKRNDSIDFDIELQKNRVMVALGGRAANEVINGIIDAGSGSDLDKAGNLVRNLLAWDAYCGFDHLYIADSDNHMNELQAGAVATMGQLYAVTKQLIIDNRQKVEAIANALIQKEILFDRDISDIIKKS